jgi:hypothetical protein
MSKKKNQHYVPQFYLRNFSKDEKSLNLFNISNKKNIIGDSIRNQCSDDYFYGKDEIIENTFQNIEDVSGELIRKIILEKYIPQLKSQDHTILQLFIVTLHSRTKFKYEELDEIIDKMGKSTLEMYPDVDKKLLSKVVVKFDYPLQFSLLNAFSSYHLAQDLRIHLLVNGSNIDFITSDHPVVYYNKWAENIKNFGAIGLASKGLLILLPLSPKILLLLYDPAIYKIGNIKDSISYINKNEDIDNINLLQWLSSNDNIYYYNESDFSKISIDSEKNIPLRNREKVMIQERDDSKSGKLIGFHSHKLKMKLNVSVIKLRKQAKRIDEGDRILKIRNPLLLTAVREFRKHVDARKYAITEWNEFIKEIVT